MGLFGGITDLFSKDKEDFYKDISPPDMEAMKVTLEDYVNQGILTPEDAQAVLQDPSAFEQIVSDPKFKEAQMKALTGLQEYADEGGLTANSKARLHDIAKDEGIRERGSREAILSNAAERGVSGSGLEFLSQLKNQQGSAERQSDRDTQVSADAENRALQALVDSGTMAGNVRGQEFNEQSRIAQAKDAINAFNTANRNKVNLYNVENRNNAMAGNLANRQGISNANTEIHNKAETYNKNLPQTNFQNQLEYAGARSGALGSDQDRRRRGIDDIENQVEKGGKALYGLF